MVINKNKILVHVYILLDSHEIPRFPIEIKALFYCYVTVPSSSQSNISVTIEYIMERPTMKKKKRVPF